MKHLIESLYLRSSRSNACRVKIEGPSRELLGGTKDRFFTKSKLKKNELVASAVPHQCLVHHYPHPLHSPSSLMPTFPSHTMQLAPCTPLKHLPILRIQLVGFQLLPPWQAQGINTLICTHHLQVSRRTQQVLLSQQLVMPSNRSIFMLHKQPQLPSPKNFTYLELLSRNPPT